jgi:hypothetical protein
MSNGLMTLAQLQALGGVSPSIPLAPAGQTNLAPLKDFDLKIGWKYTIKERVTIEPSMSAYNIFNFANFDLGVNTLSGELNGSACDANGTVRHTNNAAVDCPSDRVSVGTGTYDLGGPRVFEAGLKISF